MKSSNMQILIRRASRKRRQPLPPSMRPRGSTPVAGEIWCQVILRILESLELPLGGSFTRQPTANPDYYQIREMGVYGSAIIILVL